MPVVQINVDIWLPNTPIYGYTYTKFYFLLPLYIAMPVAQINVDI